MWSQMDYPPPPHVIKFVGVESIKLHPLALLDTSGEHLWKTQVFCNIARSAHPNLELRAFTLLCLNPGSISLQSAVEPHRVEAMQQLDAFEGNPVAVGHAVKTMSTHIESRLAK